jgi:integral membrane sensor domain MASE1
LRTVWLNLLLAAAYSTTGWLGLQLPYYGEHVTLVWAPAAIALTGIVLGGTALVPGILFGSIGVNLATAPHAWPQVLAITVGNTIGPVLAGLFLTRALEFRPQLDRVRDALAYAGIGVLGTSLVTATCGALSLYAFGDAPLADLPTAWAAWIAGDAAGLLIVGPALLTWCSIPDPALAKHIAGTEKAAMGIAFAVFAAISVAYGEKIPSLPSAFGPIFVWVVLRLGPRGVSVASVCVVICLVVATALGVGPFIADSARAGMLELWVFVAAVGCASILASALICERDLALYN